MEIEEIKKCLRKEAILFFNDESDESDHYFGLVPFKLNNEELPKDVDDCFMCPLMQIKVSALDHSLDLLKDIDYLSIFLSLDFMDHLDDLNGYFMVREIKKNEEADYSHYPPHPEITPCALKTSKVDNDYPAWDSNDIVPSIFDAICDLEDSEGVDYESDIVEEMYPTHKLGGYPSYIQGGIELGDDYQFIMQIASDDYRGLQIGDSGIIYFYRNKKGKWLAHADSY